MELDFSIINNRSVLLHYRCFFCKLIYRLYNHTLEKVWSWHTQQERGQWSTTRHLSSNSRSPKQIGSRHPRSGPLLSVMSNQASLARRSRSEQALASERIVSVTKRQRSIKEALVTLMTPRMSTIKPKEEHSLTLSVSAAPP